ncbi:hypothetical protein AVEN_215702-1 [Araneus ventricosus]|uniref:Pre-C2HC domain-containing protein n=1 Tax=Araneus ventricosus TaxID=182803 RepID=A0A4Y2WSP7_ARAVE|nr:hypothetical protein AVEN_215702-1 [Araneus ventricosus]
MTRTSEKPNRNLANNFQLPSKRLTAKTKVVINDTSNLNDGLTNDNRFLNLPNDVNDDGEASRNQAPIRKPPPIMLKRQENFTAQLKYINDNFGPVVAKSGGIFIKLYAKDPEEHAKLTSFLKEKQMEYYVIVPKWERPIKVVIRNLPRDIRPQKIKGFLENFHNLKVDKVVQLIKLRTKRPLPLFQVILPNEDQNKKIWDIENVCYMKVEIQRFQRRTGALKCFNCNHHHHAAAACQLSPRCLKCGDPTSTCNAQKILN